MTMDLYKRDLSQFLANNPFPEPLTLGFFYREKMRAIHRIAPEVDFREILEVGGGRSGLTAMLYPNAQVINLDIDPAHADAPCNRQERVRYVCGNATELPFDKDRFDLITMFDVLEHIEDDHKAAAEVRRVLRTGGYLLVSVPNENWRFPYYSPMKPICPSEEDMFAEWGHVRRGYSLTDLSSVLQMTFRGSASFISPLSVIGHDVAFSRLPLKVRRVLCTVLSPLTWTGYVLHKPESRGTETASVWQKE